MFLAAIPNLAPSAPTGKPTATVWLTGVVIVTRAASWSLLRFEVWGGERGVVEDVLVLIQISFNPSSLALCPSITPPPSLSPSLSPLHPFPPSSHHLPPQGCNTGRLSGEERVKERGRALFLYVCVEVKYSLCGVREAVSQEGDGRWGGADGQPLSSLLYCVHIYAFSLYSFNQSLFPHVSPSSFSFPMSSSFQALSFIVLFSLFHPLLSCSRWQRGAAAAAAATEQKPECEQERGVEGKGVVERGGGGERRWGSGIWRAWLRGLLRGSVYMRVVVWWIEEGERQDTIEAH